MRTRSSSVTRTFAVTALALPIVLQSAPGADPQADAGPAPVARYEGTLAQGLAEVRALTDEQQYDAALALSESLLAPTDFTRWRRELELEGSKLLLPALELADPLLESLGLNGYAEPLRAEVHYAVGLVRRAEGEPAAAEEAFGRALSLAGPGELRLDSMYNRGQTALEEGEAWRAQIPEISGQQAAPAPMGGPVAAPEEEQPDPLELAREAYLRARDQLALRLRADWRDADTRANVELIQRRLKELEDIEQQREEQQQDQDQQDQEQGSDEDQQQQDPEEQQGEEQQQEDQPEEPPTPDEQQGEQEEQQEEQQQGEGETEEQSEQQEAQEERQAEPQEVYLTREEVQRLLEQLREHEEEGEMVRERLAREMQKRVERDW